MLDILSQGFTPRSLSFFCEGLKSSDFRSVSISRSELLRVRKSRERIQITARIEEE